MLSAHPFVCGENLLRTGKSAAKKGQKGQATGAGADRSSRLCLAARVLGAFGGGNQFCAVCAGRLGRLFDKLQTCDLVDRRLFDNPQTCDLADGRLFDKPRTRALIDRRLFDKHYTCNLADRYLFDKPRTRALIYRCLFASGEAARSVSRGLFDSGHQRASWATSRMARHHRSPLWGRGFLSGKDKAARISIPLRADLRA